MHVLISNDDGVHAPGIKILAQVLSEVAQVTVIAPLAERSTTGHTLTLDSPLRLVEVEKDVYGCSGYPADCVLMGIGHLLKDRRPDLVISGINRGANLAQDVYYSGTVAAAREATFHGVPAIAVSLVVEFKKVQDPHQDHYESAAVIVKNLISQSVHKKIRPMQLLNINVPNLPLKDIRGVKTAHLGFRRYSEEIQKRQDFRERDYFWVGGIYKGYDMIPNSDCELIDKQWATLTDLPLLPNSAPQDEWQQFLERLV